MNRATLAYRPGRQHPDRRSSGDSSFISSVPRLLDAGRLAARTLRRMLCKYEKSWLLWGSSRDSDECMKERKGRRKWVRGRKVERRKKGSEGKGRKGEWRGEEKGGKGMRRRDEKMEWGGEGRETVEVRDYDSERNHPLALDDDDVVRPVLLWRLCWWWACWFVDVLIWWCVDIEIIVAHHHWYFVSRLAFGRLSLCVV